MGEDCGIDNLFVVEHVEYVPDVNMVAYLQIFKKVDMVNMCFTRDKDLSIVLNVFCICNCACERVGWAWFCFRLRLMMVVYDDKDIMDV